MEIEIPQTHRSFENVANALFLTAISCNVLATLQWLRLLPWVAAGVWIPLLYPLIPSQKKKTANGIFLGVIALSFLIRFSSILDGWKLLANQMFRLSQMTQAYEYDYFFVKGESSVEAVLWMAVLAGFLCALWPRKCNAVLCGGWSIAMAYFGVTPGVRWLVFLVLAGLLCFLPGQQRWFYGAVVTVLVAAIAFAAVGIAPQPNKAVSTLDDHLRDVLAGFPVTYEQTPVPTQVPEPEIIPPPEVEQEQPDHGVQKAALNILFIALTALAMVLLFVPAILKDRAEKKRETARAGLADPDHATAIRAMYLYARKWRELSQTPGEIPAQVYAIWQEAAYSDHTMNNAQREAVRAYMAETAKVVWAEADWKKRLAIRYRICL